MSCTEIQAMIGRKDFIRFGVSLQKHSYLGQAKPHVRTRVELARRLNALERSHWRFATDGCAQDASASHCRDKSSPQAK